MAFSGKVSVECVIDAIGPENFKDYVDGGLPIVWCSLNANDTNEQKSIVDALMPFAREAKRKLSCTWVDATEYAQHVPDLGTAMRSAQIRIVWNWAGITETAGILIAGDNNKKFLFDGKVSDANALQAFFEGYAADSLEVHLKSEPVPESNDENMYVLVGSEFEKVVGQENDVFVEFYASWCGHYKRLSPEYEKDIVIIAKADATENDLPEDIKDFPTLLFNPKEQTEAVKYAGNCKKEAIIEWIKENTSGDVSKDMSSVLAKRGLARQLVTTVSELDDATFAYRGAIQMNVMTSLVVKSVVCLSVSVRGVVLCRRLSSSLKFSWRLVGFSGIPSAVLSFRTIMEKSPR